MDLVRGWIVKPQRQWAGIVLEGPGDVILEHTLCFNFQASNNQVKYEAFIAGLGKAR